jgi:aspartate racemase
LTRAVLREQSRQDYLRVVRQLADDGAEAIVLGCTEIGLLIEQQHIPDVPLLDTTVLHIERAVQVAVGALPLPTTET